MEKTPPTVEFEVGEPFILADLPYVDLFAQALAELGVTVSDRQCTDKILAIDDMADYIRENYGSGLYAYSGDCYYRFDGLDPKVFMLLAHIYSAIADWAMTRYPELFDKDYEDVFIELVKNVFSAVLYTLDK